MDTARKRVLLHRPASEVPDSAGSVAEVRDDSPLLRDRSVSVEDESLIQARCKVVICTDHLQCCLLLPKC